ncbi:uracil-DNA glycosylase [Sphingomonas sp. TREG-RG-20F-R18-01]|uniref:uracil-DNA glycosylase n=1 Tax=Sphingomonas sp. TREG-RG-20F-R18-01 TaxID=2914982 RepID=UPI001F56837B|nr:uracil-DNA glycosylase [Sphingomonas sp. TREG-RG-20F-R18-01]
MGADQNIDWQIAVASTLDWWREAGVDTLADELPRDWTAAPAPVVRETKRRVVAEAAVPVVQALPATIDAFAAWRTGPDAPEATWAGSPIATSGNPQSAIMVITDVPDREDAESGTLLSGAAGRLFDRMLAAIGRDRNSVYVVPMCTIRPVAGRIAPEIETRLGELIRHHVAIVAPKRLFVLGNASSRALTGADVTRSRGSLQLVNVEVGQSGASVAVETVASYHPRLLLERPAEKARAWKDLQMLIAGLDA